MSSTTVRGILPIWHPVGFKGLFTHISNSPEYNMVKREGERMNILVKGELSRKIEYIGKGRRRKIEYIGKGGKEKE